VLQSPPDVQVVPGRHRRVGCIRVRYRRLLRAREQAHAPSIDVVYAGKAFTVPAAGQCALWIGFCQSPGCSPDNVQTGTACTASNGSHVSFGITTFYSPSNRQWDWIRLDLPGLSGFGNVNNFEEGFAKTVNYNASAVACNPSVGPVP
jgi:hypothetical protein